MSQSKKKIIIAGGTVAVVALVCIFGGQYLANKIADDRAGQPEPAAMQPIKADQAKVEPIVEATVYDETGKVAIKPTPEDKAEAEANAVTSAQENATKPQDVPAPTAPTTTEPKAETKPAPTPEPTPAPAPAPKPEPEPKLEPTPEPEQSTPKDSGGHEGQVYDPVFGWTDVSDAESVPMEDQGGDYDKIVGTMD